jgi:integrase
VQRRVQSSSPLTERLPYVVMRGASGQPTYKRRIPAELRHVTGSSTITIRLGGHPHGNISQRQQFLSSYSRTHQQAELRIARARGEQRELSAIEQLGVAGAWAKQAGPQGSDTVIPEEVAAILQALSQLGQVLPLPVPGDWCGDQASGNPELVPVVRELAHALHALEHPGLAPFPGGELVWGDGAISPAALISYLEQCVRDAAFELSRWLQQSQRQLDVLGLVVSPEQRQLVALRMARAATALGRQELAIEAGKIVPPLAFPDPPEGSTAVLGFGDALERWQTLRGPAPKTRLDAERRIAELRGFLGHDRLDQLTAQQVSDWRAQLIATSSVTTVKRKLALVRAVLQAAAADGMPIDSQAVERLSAKGLRESGGTKKERRPFSQQEAALLWRLSREQQGPRPFDRWAFPLGLSLGCRIEELVGLQQSDVRQIDGVWVVEIQPTEDRRLKSNSSARRVPIPQVLIDEGFISWAQRQGDGCLFSEPEPPASDPRRSHYASVRISRMIRKQAGISDKTAVFHSCRHTVAQSLVDLGAQQRVIEQLLGHSSKSMTARYSRGGIPLGQLAAAMEARDWSWVPPLGRTLRVVA